MPYPSHDTEEVRDLLALVEQLAEKELAPRADDFEARAEFPREVIRTLGRAGLFGLPFPVEYGGGGQSQETYITVLEILARRWLCVAQSVNVHVLSCYGLAAIGGEEQRARLLPDMLAGELLGGNCLSEPEVGSDIAAIGCTAVLDGDEYVINGTKAWTSHAGQADYPEQPAPEPRDSPCSRSTPGRRGSRCSAWSARWPCAPLRPPPSCSTACASPQTV